jgi:hypothetical protein
LMFGNMSLFVFLVFYFLSFFMLEFVKNIHTSPFFQITILELIKLLWYKAIESKVEQQSRFLMGSFHTHNWFFDCTLLIEYDIWLPWKIRPIWSHCFGLEMGHRHSFVAFFSTPGHQLKLSFWVTLNVWRKIINILNEKPFG